MYTTKKILIGLLLFTVINLIANRFFTRFDFTEGQIYTLSPSTSKIVSQLPDGIEIRAYISEKMPPQYINSKTQLKDKLDEYRNLSNGKIKVAFADPVSDKDAETIASALGIPALDLQVIEKDQMQVVKAYFGLAVVKIKKDAAADPNNPTAQFDSHEVLPVVENMDNLEYDLGSMLLKIGSIEQKSIAFIKGHGEHELSSGNNQYNSNQDQARADYIVQDMLQRNYLVKTIDLSQNKDNANPFEGITTIILAGPMQTLPDEDVKKIQEFIAKGGNAIFLIDRMSIQTQYGLSAVSVKDDFQNLLAPWGVIVEPKLLADNSASTASFSQGFMTYSIPYPVFAKVTDLNKNNNITRNLDSFVLPWGSPLQVAQKDGVKTEILAQSSSKFRLLTEEEVTVPAETNPESATPNPEVKKQLKPIDLSPQQDFGIQGAREQTPVILAVLAQRENEGKIILVGDSDFASSNFTSQGESNVIFFMNMIDSLSLGEDLIAIRSKGVSDRPIKQIDETEKNMIKWGITIGVPLIFVFYGLYRRSARNSKKFIQSEIR